MERFGPFQISRELAKGAQGVVLEASYQGQRCALKLLRQAMPKHVLRFKQEARVLAQLSHPNLPRVIAQGEEEGVAYLALELIEGQDLARLLDEKGPPPLDWAARVLVSVAEALEHCHRQGVVHRDLKPANVVIERGSGRPVLVDFGLIKADPEQMPLGSIEDLVARLSRTGEIRGTPSFMAPEQIVPARFGPLSPRTDVYALGGTLYMLLTGAPPVDADSFPAAIAQVLRGPRPTRARSRRRRPRRWRSSCSARSAATPPLAPRARPPSRPSSPPRSGWRLPSADPMAAAWWSRATRSSRSWGAAPWASSTRCGRAISPGR